MITILVDLTQLCTVKEIQFILSSSDEYRTSSILENSAYRQQLIEYVLSNLNHRYLTIENLTEIPQQASDILPECPIDERLQIRQLLQQGMSKIARQLLQEA